MCHCAPVLESKGRLRVPGGWESDSPGRPSAMCSSGKCSRIHSHCASLRRSTLPIIHYVYRLRRGPQYAQRDIQVPLAPSVSRPVLPSAACVRPASATARTTRRAMAPTMTLRRIGLPCVLSPPALPRRLRQNTRPSGYAGVVALRFASMCSSDVSGRQPKRQGVQLSRLLACLRSSHGHPLRRRCSKTRKRAHVGLFR